MWAPSDYSQSRFGIENAAEVKKVSRQIDEYVMAIVASSDKFCKARKSCAFVTTALPAFDFGLKAFLASVRVSDIPFVVLVSHLWEFDADFKECIIPRRADALQSEMHADRFEYGDTLTRPWIFGLPSLDGTGQIYAYGFRGVRLRNPSRTRARSPT